MLQDFPTRFPQSPVKSESQFYLGLAYRLARKYDEAVSVLGDYVKQRPKSDLAPYAWLEMSQALTSLERYTEAAKAAGEILKRFPKSPIADRALLARAEARLKGRDYDGAQADFHSIGSRALTDDDRFTYLLREADCLEAARRYDDELALLRGAIALETPPAALQPGQQPPPPTPSGDRYGRLTLRIGTAELLAGQLDGALEQYANAVHDYPKSAIAAEAQYLIGYAYETTGDDFERAQQEYAKVKDQLAASTFNTQASQRSANLERIAQYRTGSGADSLEKRAEAGFLTAEQYLFQLDKPERALEEYGRVAADYPGTPVAGRALLAQAWVLSRRLEQPARADSLFWTVVRKYPATEAQLAARDYLEAEGATVDPSLIVMPKPPAPTRADSLAAQALSDTVSLTRPPAGTLPIGPAPDSLARGRLLGPGGPPAGAPFDSLLQRARGFTRVDSIGLPPAVLPDTTRRDSLRTIDR